MSGQCCECACVRRSEKEKRCWTEIAGKLAVVWKSERHLALGRIQRFFFFLSFAWCCCDCCFSILLHFVHMLNARDAMRCVLAWNRREYDERKGEKKKKKTQVTIECFHLFRSFVCFAHIVHSHSMGVSYRGSQNIFLEKKSIDWNTVYDYILVRAIRIRTGEPVHTIHNSHTEEADNATIYVVVILLADRMD